MIFHFVLRFLAPNRHDKPPLVNWGWAYRKEAPPMLTYMWTDNHKDSIGGASQ
ncbi:hypothetical protein TAMA11512_12210 [Selenomonas sp. TAMA-11512]|nr:hypothetical protein TAMA11512_12210 [Selenomonas sp. TAMA-11512]